MSVSAIKRGDPKGLQRRLQCRECLLPALQQTIASAEQFGWSSNDIQLAIIEMAVENLQLANTDLATMLEVKRIAWRARVNVAA